MELDDDIIIELPFRKERKNKEQVVMLKITERGLETLTYKPLSETHYVLKPGILDFDDYIVMRDAIRKVSRKEK